MRSAAAGFKIKRVYTTAFTTLSYVVSRDMGGEAACELELAPSLCFSFVFSLLLRLS